MRKKKLTERFTVKVFAYFLTVLSFFAAAVGVVAAVNLADAGVYHKELGILQAEALQNIVVDKGWIILDNVQAGELEEALAFCENTNLQFALFDSRGDCLGSNYQENDTPYAFRMEAGKYNTNEGFQVSLFNGGKRVRELYGNTEWSGDLKNGWSLYLYVEDSLPYHDDLRSAVETVTWLYSIRFHLIWVTACLAVLCIISFLFQICSAGRHYGQEKVTAGGIARIPVDLLTVVASTGLASAALVIDKLSLGDAADAVCVGLILLAAVTGGVGYCLIWAIQVKSGIWWKNMLVCRLFKIIRKIFCLMGKALLILFHNLPSLIRVVIGIMAVLLVEFLLLVLWGMDAEDLVALWLIEKIIAIVLILYLALVLGRLKKGSEALAEGELNYQLDTGWMYGECRELGENLNCIAGGMNRAVEERMKSERLKTELITNVSHDIKTPLTSIINYAELIAEEPSENEKITEYAQVLKRQSARLKKLIEDLMEASKASTGNMEVHMAPCEVGVLLTQTVGEYEQRLNELGLSLVTRQPQHPVRIMADGKLLWRIFDNLLNNICKYAQNGTRVYLTVEERDSKVNIAFKNTSRYQLDLTGEELTDRFVRGDRSRNTEGNGLGLSIAQSLTGLQGGSLELTVDGDLFKVVLIFELLFTADLMTR